MNDEPEQEEKTTQRVFEDCPYCGAVVGFEFTLAEEGELQLVTCDKCGEAFAVRPWFSVSLDIYLLRTVPSRKRKPKNA